MKTLLLTLLFASSLSQSFEMGINDTQIAPMATIYYTKDGAKIRQSGTLYLLGQYIAKFTQEPTTYTVIMRKDAERQLAQSKIQSLCYMTPQWLKLKKNQVVFSKPFMRNHERLISRKPIPLIKEKRDLHNLTLGLVKGFHYPAIQDLIDRDYVHSEYHQNEHMNFISLFQEDKLDAVIFKQVAFKQLMQTLPSIVGKNTITIHPLSLGELEVSCALSSASKHYLPQINAAIDAFTQDYPL